MENDGIIEVTGGFFRAKKKVLRGKSFLKWIVEKQKGGKWNFWYNFFGQNNYIWVINQPNIIPFI